MTATGGGPTASFRAKLLQADGVDAFGFVVPANVIDYHVDTIDAAKSDETRRRRIDKVVALFAAGKKR